MKNIDNNQIKKAASSANIDISALKSAVQNNNVEDFINKNLSAEASAKLKSILSDKASTEKLLSTPQAKELLNKFIKD